MLTTEKLTIYLPLALLREFQSICNSQSRTRSEVIRSALRVYFDQHYSGIRPTESEISAVRQGREEYQQGSSVSLGQFVNELKSAGDGSGANRLLAAAAKRAGPTTTKTEDKP